MRVRRYMAGIALAGFMLLPAFSSGMAQNQEAFSPEKRENRRVLRLTLQESIRMALARSPQMKAARARLEMASARLGQARTNFFPKLEGTASYTRLDIAPFIPVKSFASVFGGGAPGSQPGVPVQALPKKITIGDDENYVFSVQLRQPIFTGGLVWNGYRMAQYGEQAAVLNYRNTQQELTFQVEEAYWNIVKAQKLTEIAEQSIKQAEAHIRDVENMFRVGLLTRNEVLRAKLQLSNVRSLKIASQKARQLVAARFCSLIGVPLDTPIQLMDSLTYEPPEELTLEQVQQEALANRLDLKMLELNARIGEKSVAMSQASYLPSVFLVADYGYRRPDREYNPDFYSTWTVSLVAQWKLFDWGERSYKQQEARAQLEEIHSNLKAAKDGILLQVTQDFYALKEAVQKVEIARLALEQAEENFRITDDFFDQGMVTHTAYLDASSALLQARNNYVTSLADYRIARARLMKSMGRQLVR